MMINVWMKGKEFVQINWVKLLEICFVFTMN